MTELYILLYLVWWFFLLSSSFVGMIFFWEIYVEKYSTIQNLIDYSNLEMLWII